MNPIRLPRAAVQLAASPDAELVEIRQTAEAAVLTVAAGQRVLRLAVETNMPGTVEPFTILAADLVHAAAAVGASPPGPAGELPLVVVRISASMAGIAGPSGMPQTITICTTPFPDCGSRIDVVQGELASGMTRAVAALEPRHLVELAGAALAIGCTAVQFTFAPRFGAVLAEAEAAGVSAAVVLTGPGGEQIEPVAHPTTAARNPMVFRVAAPGARAPARRSPPPLAYPDKDLPF